MSVSLSSTQTWGAAPPRESVEQNSLEGARHSRNTGQDSGKFQHPCVRVRVCVSEGEGVKVFISNVYLSILLVSQDTYTRRYLGGVKEGELPVVVSIQPHSDSQLVLPPGLTAVLISKSRKITHNSEHDKHNEPGNVISSGKDEETLTLSPTHTHTSTIYINS